MAVDLIVCIFMIIVMLILDLLSVGLNGWLYSLISMLMGFIFSGLIASGDQQIIINTFFDPSTHLQVYEVMPSYPLFILLFVTFSVVSTLIMLRTVKSSY